MGKSVSKKVSSGLFWTFGERILAQGVSFVVSIVLARMLLPQAYGVISLVLVFINIANVFVSDGLGASLVQKKDATKEDFSTIFVCSLILSITLYLVLFFLAPMIAQFYNNEILIPVIRILAFKLPLSAINGIQHAYVSKHLLFKKFFFSTLGGTVLSGVVGIAMAATGFGVWALVAQYLVNSTVDTVILLLSVEWKPSFRFRMQSAKQLLGFGFRMMISSLINTVYSEMQSLVIGKVYSANDLAYYKKSKQFPSLFITNICSSVSTVLFPTMANNAGSIAEVKKMTKRSLQITAYVVTPLMLGLMAIAEPLVRLLLTDKWLPCVPYMQLLCIAYLFQPIQTANCQAIKAIGRSDIYLKTEIIKKCIGVALLLICLHKGVMAIAIAFVLTVMISSVITMIPNISLLKYGIKEQILDLAPAFVQSVVMFALIYPLSYLRLHSFFVLMIQVVAGIVLYVGMSQITKNDSFRFILRSLKKEQ